MKNFLFGVLIMFSFFTGGCKAQIDSTKEMSVEQLKERLNDKSLIIIDVRTKEELSGSLGQIDGVINIPVQELKSRLDEIKKYKENEIAVICRSGNRSNSATQFLRDQGFNAKNVVGGMISFRKNEN